jgi:hypothetical protein
MILTRIGTSEKATEAERRNRIRATKGREVVFFKI